MHELGALNDGGCTYTLGPQPRSTMSNNYCSSDHAPVVGCFYHDNGVLDILQLQIMCVRHHPHRVFIYKVVAMLQRMILRCLICGAETLLPL